MKKNLAPSIAIIVFMIIVHGCATKGQSRNAYQAGATGLGALIGQIIGGDTGATLIGAGIGFVVGGLTKDLIYPDHDNAAIAAASQGKRVRYRVSDSHSAPVYTAEPIRQEGNCTWVQEKEWKGSKMVRQWTKKVCHGTTPWNPGAPE